MFGGERLAMLPEDVRYELLRLSKEKARWSYALRLALRDQGLSPEDEEAAVERYVGRAAVELG